jgi:tetratricopeptide (TPR) repeat protein
MVNKLNFRNIFIPITATALLPAVILLLASGCAFLGPGKAGYTPKNQAVLENLLSEQQYYKAGRYLEKMALGKNNKNYISQRRRLIRLTSELEKDVAEKVTARVDMDDYASAIDIINRALKKVPESKIVLDLDRSLHKERDRRLAVTEQNLLLSKAEYMLSQLEWHEEQALLDHPSLFSRWQMSSIKRSLNSLHPDLIDCGKKARETKQQHIAERCLHMAAMIKKSKVVDQLLDQINTDGAGQSIVPLSEAKKSRPASATAPPFLEMEAKLKAEIEKGELLKAYATLAELSRFPGKREQMTRYRQQLDTDKRTRITQLLQQGASLYRISNIAEARSKWQEVLRLDPDNHTANEKIARADKVLKKLQYLKESQQKIPTSQ